MSVCQLTLQEHIEGISSTDKFAIVPDIQIYSFGSDLQGSKRYRSDSDISFGEEDLDLLGQDQQLQLNSYSFQEPKRHCSGYSISCPSPDQFQLVENTTSTALCSEVFSPQVQETYDFGASKDTNIFTCGGNSPVSSASSPSAANFAATRTQAPAACQQVVDFQSLVPIEFLPDMQRQPQTVLSQLSQHTEKYELVITEQPEEVRWFVHCKLVQCHCVYMTFFYFLLQYYRARYCSEGVRAPLKGMTENFPTVQVCIYHVSSRMVATLIKWTVKLVRESSILLLHLLCLIFRCLVQSSDMEGSTLNLCMQMVPHTPPVRWTQVREGRMQLRRRLVHLTT